MEAAERVSPLIYRPFSLEPPRSSSYCSTLPFYSFPFSLSLSFRRNRSLCTNTIAISFSTLFAPSLSHTHVHTYIRTCAFPSFHFPRSSRFSFTGRSNEQEGRPHQPLPVHKRRVKQINKFYGGAAGQWRRW